jgi:hypothetical protein
MVERVERRGRQAENDTLILKYTQDFKDHTGTTYKWIWDKSISPNGPLSVEIKDKDWIEFDRKENQLNAILQKYEVKGNQRKPRITKVDKEAIEVLENEINEIWYGFYPEDRPKVRKNAKKK